MSYLRKFDYMIDAHVLDGKQQGTKSVLKCLLREIADLGAAKRFCLMCYDPKACEEIIGRSGFHYEVLADKGQYFRILIDLPNRLSRAAPRLAVFQYISPLFSRTKSVVFIHDILPLTHPHLFPPIYALRCRLLYSISIANAEKVVAVSQEGARQIRDVFPRAAEKTVVVRNGPSFGLDAYKLDQDFNLASRQRPYILAVGRIERRKNIDLLVKSFLAAGIDNVELRLVGNFDMGYRYCIPKDPRVVVMNNIHDRELIELYRNASLFVYPSSAEGFGMPLLDAVLFGLPVISSNQTSMPEVAGELAVFFDPTDSDAEVTLSGLIRSHFKDEPIMGPTRKQRVLHSNTFSWRRSAEHFLTILDGTAVLAPCI